MSITAPLPLISDSLKGLGLNTDTLFFALNYEFTKTEPKGMLKRFKKNQSSMDIDIACVLYDDQCTIIDMVWFKQLRDSSESVRHQGDSINGKDRGKQALYNGPVDQEQIRLFMDKIPASVSHIALLLSSYHGHPIAKVAAGKVNLNDDEGQLAFRLNLNDLPKDCTALWVGHLRRGIDDWFLTQHNLPLKEHDLHKAAQQVAHELARSLPTPQALKVE